MMVFRYDGPVGIPEDPRYGVPRDLPFEYGTFVIDCVPPYWLYQVVVPEGYLPPAYLEGSFTTVEILKKRIDDYLKSNPDKTAATAFEKIVAPRGRGRPKKAAPVEMEPSPVDNGTQAFVYPSHRKELR